MTADPQDGDENENQTDLNRPPLEDGDAGRQVAHLTGMTPDAAATFASFYSGRYAPFRRS